MIESTSYRLLTPPVSPARYKVSFYWWIMKNMNKISEWAWLSVIKIWVCHWIHTIWLWQIGYHAVTQFSLIYYLIKVVSVISKLRINMVAKIWPFKGNFWMCSPHRQITASSLTRKDKKAEILSEYRFIITVSLKYTKAWCSHQQKWVKSFTLFADCRHW